MNTGFCGSNRLTMPLSTYMTPATMAANPPQRIRFKDILFPPCSTLMLISNDGTWRSPAHPQTDCFPAEKTLRGCADRLATFILGNSPSDQAADLLAVDTSDTACWRSL